jgi:hypothetical protein
MTLSSQLPPLEPILTSYPAGVRIRPYTDAQTQAFLADDTDLDDTLLLWDRKSGYPGMLEAVERPMVQLAASIWEVIFDNRVGRYRYIKSGRFTSAANVRAGVLRVSVAQEQVMASLTQSLIDGELTQRQWYLQMRKAMKDQYRSSWLASIGGQGNYTRSEVSKFGWAIRDQYKWLDHFFVQLQTGEQALNGFAIRRARMYARAGNGIYQNNLLRIAIEHGMRKGRRVLGENDNHCHDSTRPGCIELAKKGWISIWELTPIGSAACLSNDLCRYEFRK